MSQIAWILNSLFYHHKNPKKQQQTSQCLLLHSGVNTIWSNMMKPARTHGNWYHNQGQSLAFWQAGDYLFRKFTSAYSQHLHLNPKLNISKYSLHILYLAGTWFIPHLTKRPSKSVQLLVSLSLVTPWLGIGRKTMCLVCFSTGAGIQALHNTASSSAPTPQGPCQQLLNSLQYTTIYCHTPQK